MLCSLCSGSAFNCTHEQLLGPNPHLLLPPRSAQLVFQGAQGESSSDQEDLPDGMQGLGQGGGNLRQAAAAARGGSTLPVAFTDGLLTASARFCRVVNPSNTDGIAPGGRNVKGAVAAPGFF